MQWDLKALLLVLFAPAAVAALISLVVQNLTKGSIDNYFYKRLETHKADLKREEERLKNELGLITEAAKFDYSRRLSDFNLFTKEKHRVYAELFKSCRETNDLAARLQKEIWWAPKYDVVSVADLSGELAELGVPVPEREDMLNNWNSTNFTSDGVKLLNESLARKARRDAIESLTKAQNAHLQQALFLSDAVDDLVKRFVVLAGVHLYQGKNGEHEHYHRLEVVQGLRRQMKAELAIDSSPTSLTGSVNAEKDIEVSD